MPDLTPELCRAYRGECRVGRRNGVPKVEKADEKIHASAEAFMASESGVCVDDLGQLVIDPGTTYHIDGACPAFGTGWFHLSLVHLLTPTAADG